MTHQTPTPSRPPDELSPFGVDFSAFTFHWEPFRPGINDLRIEGHYSIRDGHLYIDRITAVEFSRLVVGDDGIRRERTELDYPVTGIDSAKWKRVPMGRVLADLKGHITVAIAFHEARPGEVPEHVLAQARQLIAPTRSRRRVRLHDTFLAALSEEYLDEVAKRGYGAVKRLAARRNTPVEAVRGWLKRARKDKWIVTDRPGGTTRISAGPKLLAWRKKRTED